MMKEPNLDEFLAAMKHAKRIHHISTVTKDFVSWVQNEVGLVKGKGMIVSLYLRISADQKFLNDATYLKITRFLESISKVAGPEAKILWSANADSKIGDGFAVDLFIGTKS